MFRNLMIAILAALPLAGGSLGALAQDSASTATAGARPSPFQHILKEMDTNGDGKISPDEYVAAATKRFQSVEVRNKAGIAAASAPAAMTRERNMAQRELERLDTNHDGVVTRAEYLAAAGARFDAMDTAHTGKLTAQELAATTQEFSARHEARPMGPNRGVDANMTLEQYQSRAKARFTRLDRNGNGFLEADELTGRHGARAQPAAPAH